MLHRVAERLGYRDVDAMVDEIPKAKLVKWMAVSRLDGWGDGWYMVARICAAIYNGFALLAVRMGRPVPESDAREPYDFLPEYLKDKPQHKPTSEKPIGNSGTEWMRQMAGL